jgi:hypothetical protein
VWARESRTHANLHARKSVVVIIADGTGACELHVRYVSDCMRLRFRFVSAFTADFRVYRPPYQTVLFSCSFMCWTRSGDIQADCDSHWRQVSVQTILKRVGFFFSFLFCEFSLFGDFFLKINRIFLYIKNKIA